MTSAGRLEALVRRHPALLRWAYRTVRCLGPLLSHPLAAIPGYIRFFRERRAYLAAGGRANAAELYPCLFDRVASTPFDPHYFFQAAWLARRLAEVRPSRHVDVGSSVQMIGMLSAFVPVIFFDYRPLRAQLPGMSPVAGNIVRLPLRSLSLASLSCLHVIEHIGLGRYGDPCDPQGGEKAARELQRVVAPGGRLFLSLPIGRERVCFNAHRVHLPENVPKLFPELRLESFSFIDDAGKMNGGIAPSAAPAMDYGCGLFEFSRPAP